MPGVVGVVRGTDKIAGFQELLGLTDFEQAIMRAYQSAHKAMGSFRIAIKPNMMVFINPSAHEATVTDKDLVEYLIDRVLGLGFTDISVCEAQHDVGRMLKNHNVAFVAERIGYQPRSRYKVVDLTLESVRHRYDYLDSDGKLKSWWDRVGKTWRDADFRISFAKCKTHEHDWMTLAVKNIYGCFPSTNKVAKYHIRNEIFDVTARSIRNFPVHFSFVDAWIGSDGFQGYKIANPKELKMLFGGEDAVAVDMEIFKRAGLDPHKSRILRRAVEQLHQGKYPEYVVRGDRATLFSQLAPWENISDEIVESIDLLEEVYISWAFINLRPSAEIIDYSLFPPRNVLMRFLVWLTKKLYSVFKITRWFRRLYGTR